ncbi:hypothetical protein HEP_00421400, partial [Hepatocystis sp. ex Piliocolobus tephrosceles]
SVNKKIKTNHNHCSNTVNFNTSCSSKKNEKNKDGQDYNKHQNLFAKDDKYDGGNNNNRNVKEGNRWGSNNYGSNNYDGNNYDGNNYDGNNYDGNNFYNEQNKTQTSKDFFSKKDKDKLNIKKLFLIFYTYLKNNNFIDSKHSCEKLYTKFMKKYLKSANVYLQFISYLVFSIYDYNTSVKKYLDYIHLYSDISKYNIFLHMLNIDRNFDHIYTYQTLQLTFHPYFYLMYKLYKLLKIDASPIAGHNFYENLEEFISSNSLFQPSQNYFTLIKKHFNNKCVMCDVHPQKVHICLYCGLTTCVVDSVSKKSDSQNQKTCISHDIMCGGGQCLYLWLNTSMVVYASQSKLGLFTGPYVDKNGDIDKDLKRGKNLYLSSHKMNKLYDNVVNSLLDIEMHNHLQMMLT